MKHRILMLWPPYRHRQEWHNAYFAIPGNREKWQQFGRNIASIGFTIRPRR